MPTATLESGGYYPKFCIKGALAAEFNKMSLISGKKPFTTKPPV